MQKLERVTLYGMDCRDAMGLFMAENSVDSIVTDPPYGISFMGRAWDRGVPGVEFWQRAFDVLKPGGHLLAFSGSRTYHRMVCAIEDAGFEIRDQIVWVYGSGFPKSLDVSKAIDKAAGAERVGNGEMVRSGCRAARGGDELVGSKTIEAAKWKEVTQASTEAAQQWQGWGTALKPAFEPICVARKPLIGTVAANVLHWGTGALNIDACRVGSEIRFNAAAGNVAAGNSLNTPAIGMPQDVDGREVAGRWPANLIHDGSDEVLAAFPVTGSGAMKRTVEGYDGEGVTGFLRGRSGPQNQHGDAGSAARFFYCAKASKADRNGGLNGHETVILEWSLTLESPKWDNVDQRVTLQVDTGQSPPKVIAVSGVSNKSAHEWSTLLFGSEHTAPCLQGTTCIIETPTSSTTGLTTLSYFQNLLTSANTQVANYETESGGSPAQTAAPGTLLLRTTSGLMASALGVEHAASPTLLKISVSARRSDHPTVKPTDLMAYLCRLVTPPGGVVLDPFMGSGSTGKAALREGFRFIGCELDESYMQIAQARLAAEAGVRT